MIACATVVGMVDPPADPSTSRSSPPGPNTMVGAIEESGTLPGPGAFSDPPRTSKAFITPGATAKSSISSLSTTPVPRATTHDPKGSFTVVVSAFSRARQRHRAGGAIAEVGARRAGAVFVDELARRPRHPGVEVGVAPA